MPNKLKELTIEEVSLVDEPANPGSRVMLFKRKEPTAPIKERIAAWFQKAFGYNESEAKSFQDCWQAAKLDDFWWKSHDALRRSISSIVESDIADKASLVKQSLNDYLNTVMNVLDLSDEPERMMLHKAHDKLQEQLTELHELSQALDEDIAKAGKMISSANMKRLSAALDAIQGILTAAGANKEPEEGKTTKKGRDNMPDTKTLETVFKAMLDKGLTNEDTKVIEDELAKARIAAKPLEDTKPVQIDKSTMSEEMRKAWDAMETKAAKVDEVEAVAKAAQEELEKQRFTKMAEKYPFIKGTSEEKVTLLRKAYAAGDEFGKSLEDTLAAANTAVEQSELLKEIGKVGADDENSPEGKLANVAKSLREANPNLTEADALKKAVEMNPSLYTEANK